MTPQPGKPRIALVYGDYPPNPPGRADGGSDFLRHLAEGLVAAGHQVTAIVSRRDDRPAAFTSAAGVRVAPIVHDWSLGGAFGGQVGELREVVGEDRVDVVHLIYPDPFLRYGTDSYHLPFLLKAALRRPLVVTFFGFGVTGSGLVAKLGLPALFAAADRLVITDADLLQRFRRTLPWWAGKSRTGLVGSIMEAGWPAWSQAALAQRKLALGLKPAERHVGFFGFWSPDKGLENLLQAIKRLREDGREVKLVLIGGRPPELRFKYEQGILRLAEDLGIADAVIETGQLSPAEVAERLVAMDLCALPFKVNPLGRSSLALVLNLGVPTVVTRPLGEGSALLEGLALVDAPEPDQVAAAIARLLDDPSAQRATAEAAVRAARQWSWESIVGQYERLYDEVRRSR